jgi:AcrR family transcriptional regulator
MNLEAFERRPLEKRVAVINAGIREFAVKSYSDASTDRITADCGISKGLLFHYFTTKQEFYLYCLQKALETLTADTAQDLKGDFFEILFSSMDSKMRLCTAHPEKTYFVNMASRENAAEVKAQKDDIFRRTLAERQARSAQTMACAVSSLHLKVPDKHRVTEGLLLYTNAIMNRFLLHYQENPAAFFENSDAIKAEMKSFLNLMLYGICEEEKL